jgi:hypothetical protein
MHFRPHIIAATQYFDVFQQIHPSRHPALSLRHGSDATKSSAATAKLTLCRYFYGTMHGMHHAMFTFSRSL